VENDIQTIPIASAPWPTLVRETATRVMHYNASLPEQLIEALWDRPAEVTATGRIMRETPYRSAVLIQAGPQSYVMKQYFRRSRLYGVRRDIAGSQAWRSYNLGCTLADAGIKTPRPVACIYSRRRGPQQDSYLMYPHVEGICLRSAINKGYMRDADITKVRNQLQELWQRLKSLRVGLRDANTGNFIVTSNGDLWLIDLDDSDIHRSALLARARLQSCWLQVHRSIRRAKRTRDRRAEPLWRAA
jgi:hypothetical protein